MLKKVVHAGTRSASFVAASQDLSSLAEVEVTAKRIQRWTERVGQQRVEEREQQADAYQNLSLPERRQSPEEQVPQVACVMIDGGRLQVRDRKAVSQQRQRKGHWKESLVGCCLRMTSEVHAKDPCPSIPKTFVDPLRIGDLSREIKGYSHQEGVADGDQPLASSVDAPADRPSRPELLVRSVVATRQGQAALGERLIAEAYSRGFNASERQAFVADGAASNWSVHRKHFSHYTPILDFTHAICYVYAAAMAGRSKAAGWSDYVLWAQWLWEGSTELLIEAVAARSDNLGPPSEESSPAAIVARTLVYLKNQRTRMKYHQYRKRGLPITSSHIESTIKQINRRVKGSEKFWHQGAEPMLQLAADHLSETDSLNKFWKRRPKQIRKYRCYQTAA